MLDEQCGDLPVRFKAASTYCLLMWVIWSNDIAEDDSSILLRTSDRFKGLDIAVRRRWLDLEEESQNPSYVCERLSKPQVRTFNAQCNKGCCGRSIWSGTQPSEHWTEHDILTEVKGVHRLSATSDSNNLNYKLPSWLIEITDLRNCGTSVSSNTDLAIDVVAFQTLKLKYQQ